MDRQAWLAERQAAVVAVYDAEAPTAVLTIDVMENVPPEDWPRVTANLRRAARPGGATSL